MWQHKYTVTDLINICQNTDTQGKGSCLSFFCYQLRMLTPSEFRDNKMVDKQYSSNVYFYTMSAAERQG